MKPAKVVKVVMEAADCEAADCEAAGYVVEERSRLAPYPGANTVVIPWAVTVFTAATGPKAKRQVYAPLERWEQPERRWQKACAGCRRRAKWRGHLQRARGPSSRTCPSRLLYEASSPVVPRWGTRHFRLETLCYLQPQASGPGGAGGN